MREAVAACNGKPSLAVTPSPAGKHFMPGDAELERIGIRSSSIRRRSSPRRCTRCARLSAGLKGRVKPPMASPAELATAIRSADYLARDARWPDPR